MTLENFRRTNITLNRANQPVLEPQITKVGDVNGRELVVQIIDGDVIKDQTGVSLKLNWQHANGNQGSETFSALDAKQGLFSIYYPENMLFRGTVTANISINENGKITNSLNFQIAVKGDVFDGSAVEVDGLLFTLKDLKDQLDERDSNLVSLENRQSSVENQFNSLQQEITNKDVISAPEIIAARNGEADLKTRLDKEQQEITTQLAQTNLLGNISDSSVVNIGQKDGRKPLVTFIDDDGEVSVYSRLKPIFEARGVPCTIAIVSDWVGAKETGGQNREFMDREQILELQNLGWEVASHSKTHIALGDVDEVDIIRKEVRESKEKLLSLGFNVKNYVYPFGQENALVRKEIAKLYKVSPITNMVDNNNTNKAPLDNYRLMRVALGSFASIDTLEHHKSVIDKAIAENSWVIFMTHVWAQNEQKDQLIADVIDYTLSKGVEIANLDEGLDYFGDKVNVDGAFRVLPDNKISSDVFVIGYQDTLINSVEKANDLNYIRSIYPKKSIVYSTFNLGNALGMPSDNAGTLVTDLSVGDDGYVTQWYDEYDSDIVWIRKRNGVGAWKNWNQLATKHTHIIPTDTLDFGSISAKATVSSSVTIPGLLFSHNPIANPLFGINNGLIYSCAVIDTNTLRIKVTNITDNAIVCDKNRWVITVLS